jgi:hypothetical protein
VIIIAIDYKTVGLYCECYHKIPCKGVVVDLTSETLSLGYTLQEIVIGLHTTIKDVSCVGICSK